MVRLNIFNNKIKWVKNNKILKSNRKMNNNNLKESIYLINLMNIQKSNDDKYIYKNNKLYIYIY